jgi:hypothetical protein
MYLKSNGDWHVTGGKSSDVPLANGDMVSVYAVESPEVWFFDFCDAKDKIDPKFLEVTEGEMKFIAVDGGGFQVWRRRKDYAHKRFEPVETGHKTKEAKFQKAMRANVQKHLLQLRDIQIIEDELQLNIGGENL